MALGARPLGTRTLGDSAPTGAGVLSVAATGTTVTPESSKIVVKADQISITVIPFELVGVSVTAI